MLKFRFYRNVVKEFYIEDILLLIKREFYICTFEVFTQVGPR